MAIKFKETDKTFGAVQAVLAREEKIFAQIKTYSENDANLILKLRDELKRSWEDFSANERKLNIAVVGRVKAGKSTFLNTVIFGGKHILPEAFTPKTATLTKIEYAAENSLTVEYYGVDEWKNLEEQAKSPVESESTRVAKELVDSMKKSSVDVTEILSKGQSFEIFESEDELKGRLNRYVGEDGEITPLVKCVTLKINKPELEGISIVDTPGLNDPVASRTYKTREFLGLCDVVFFLSPASQFLDKNDVTLLKNQLPQKGVARLILICSRFDDGLVDTIFDFDNLSDAVTDTKIILQQRANEIFSFWIKEYEKNVSTDIAKMFSECRKPLFLSSLFHNMIDKKSSDYNDAEERAFDNLNAYDDLDAAQIKIIGDIAPIEIRLQEVIAQKDLTLARKAKNFVPLAEKNLTRCLEDLKVTATHKYNQLVGNDKTEIEHRQRYVETKINTIQSRLEEYFGEIYSKLESLKIEIMKDLRTSSREYSALSTRTGIDFHTEYFRVSDSKWYNPFSWGRSHKEYFTYETRYTYIDSNDALENINNYAREASNSIETGFVDGVDISNLKRRLLGLVVNVFDASDENFDPAYFRLITERTLNQIELPTVNIDVTNYLNAVSGKFSGEVRDSSARSRLQSLLFEVIAKLFDEVSAQFTTELTEFKKQLDSIKDTFSQHLLTDINKEFEELKAAYDDKENVIRNLKEYLKLFDNI